ncbi:MAG: sigma-70 family RNA polymerase sigma factor [Anaerolineae bacterium]|uniref:sigma-70 family RNA polymerase sigma factor n=1 Tax=Candidatus Amarolinea dominans TaxID=3140696 RepID=UPI001D943B42|nr:sigma-70 family RNA polymerase sigma factor [Anaerolineae bacterium]MBK7203862.1 sigma-70 family RNA polymerase sigma factor [Anaerolineae bacterium]MBK9091650.1 sigma-70 family RNA polymerase sigma factor [Anaerolineae bacterium]MBK9230265.1 sigma-70 family RNA polymerase sigma factor [Anaerolineae bacterium]
MDEQALIAAAVRGELRAFNQLLQHHQALAYNVAYRMLDDTDAAADAVQEAAIKAFRGLKTYRGGSFKAWFLRIVTNNCYDWLRARGRHGVSSLDDLAEDPDYAEALVHPGEGPEARALREELSAFISRSVNSLPPDQRLTLVLADIEGVPYQEVADICNVPLGTVKSRLSRARARLRDLLMQRAELLPQRYRLENDIDGR